MRNCSLPAAWLLPQTASAPFHFASWVCHANTLIFHRHLEENPLSPNQCMFSRRLSLFSMRAQTPEPGFCKGPAAGLAPCITSIAWELRPGGAEEQGLAVTAGRGTASPTSISAGECAGTSAEPGAAVAGPREGDRCPLQHESCSPGEPKDER